MALRSRTLPLLVVDGYNVIYGTGRYELMIDEHAGAGALADVAHLSRDPYGHDPFDRAREALIADVAAYAQGSYDPVIVFDGAGNLSEERPNFSRAGVRVLFSRTGESADTEIERLNVQLQPVGHNRFCRQNNLRKRHLHLQAKQLQTNNVTKCNRKSPKV